MTTVEILSMSRSSFKLRIRDNRAEGIGLQWRTSDTVKVSIHSQESLLSIEAE